jgi:hypothetical protein
MIDKTINLCFLSALNRFVSDLAEKEGYHFLSGITHEGEPKLIVRDDQDNQHFVDAILASESVQPLILFTWEYNRNKKHNREKINSMCNAHPAIRRHYRSIRSSIAVLAGNWSSSSLAMMKSSHINYFVIPFDRICEILDGFGVDFRWDKNDRQKSVVAWKTFNALSDGKKAQIGIEMVNTIKDDLTNLVLSILDDTTERQIESVTLEFRSNFAKPAS